VQLIEKHLNDILMQIGLQKIAVKPGDEFDPNIHEAISSEENPQIKPDHIIEVVETGYKLGTQVIRPAKVRVSKGE
jgi:molecular chaperone GrpE